MLSNAIQVGPLLLPVTPLLVLASAGCALMLGRWLAKEAREDVERTLWNALVVGVLTARLAFVFEYLSAYLANPLTLLDIRDGGWNPSFGLLGAWAVVLYRERRSPLLSHPLRWSLAVGTVLFVAGMVALSLQGSPGRKPPALDFASLEGRTIRLSEFEGKPMVVNLWATWCPPCVREMPVLHEAQRRHPDVHFVFVNQGEDPHHVARWLDDQGLPLHNVLLDPRRQASAAFKQQGYPTTLFFNARGELVSARLGELSAATLQERLEALTR